MVGHAQNQITSKDRNFISKQFTGENFSPQMILNFATNSHKHSRQNASDSSIKGQSLSQK